MFMSNPAYLWCLVWLRDTNFTPSVMLDVLIVIVVYASGFETMTCSDKKVVSWSLGNVHVQSQGQRFCMLVVPILIVYASCFETIWPVLKFYGFATQGSCALKLVLHRRFRSYPKNSALVVVFVSRYMCLLQKCLVSLCVCAVMYSLVISSVTLAAEMSVWCHWNH
jgi:hypothetical protein